MAAPAPPVPARKRSAAAPNLDLQQNITLRPLLPADSRAPIVYTLPNPAEGQMTAQTVFSGHQPPGPPEIPRQYHLGETDYDDVMIEVCIVLVKLMSARIDSEVEVSSQARS